MAYYTEREQEQRKQNNQAAIENEINKQPEYSLEQYHDLIEESKAKLEACKLKLKQYEVSTGGANILTIGYQDGRKGRQPRMPHFRNYRIQWERGFQEYVASGEFWTDAQENLIETPF